MTDNATKLARTTTVKHPAGLKIRTPLLIPSFSSKGFHVTPQKSDVKAALEIASEWLTDVMLISAYDLVHGYVPPPDALTNTPELIVVDSGGYEKRIEHDMSAAVHWPHQPKEWNEQLYQDELDKWPKRFPACFVSYDEPAIRMSLERQVEAATRLLSRYPDQLHTFLLKPEAEGQKYLAEVIDRVALSPHQLAGFHFVGVTEKELGQSMADRMLRVARLRLALDSVSISAPIHVFGALDPITCGLLFLAGAELFDGLTWLRYAFREGLCIYNANFGAIAIGTDRRDDHVKAKVWIENVHYLKKLSEEMKRFLLDRNFGHFKFHADFLRGEYDSLRARLHQEA